MIKSYSFHKTQNINYFNIVYKDKSTITFPGIVLHVGDESSES